MVNIKVIIRNTKEQQNIIFDDDLKLSEINNILSLTYDVERIICFGLTISPKYYNLTPKQYDRSDNFCAIVVLKK